MRSVPWRPMYYKWEITHFLVKPLHLWWCLFLQHILTCPDWISSDHQWICLRYFCPNDAHSPAASTEVLWGVWVLLWGGGVGCCLNGWQGYLTCAANSGELPWGRMCKLRLKGWAAVSRWRRSWGEEAFRESDIDVFEGQRQEEVWPNLVMKRIICLECVGSEEWGESRWVCRHRWGLDSRGLCGFMYFVLYSSFRPGLNPWLSYCQPLPPS